MYGGLHRKVGSWLLLQGGLALYEVLLSPPLTLHQQHIVKDMTKTSHKVTSPMLLMSGQLSVTRLIKTATAKCRKHYKPARIIEIHQTLDSQDSNRAGPPELEGESTCSRLPDILVRCCFGMSC